MCGISGWFSSTAERIDQSVLVAMADAMNHRGPDDRGYYADEGHGVALASNRLSIIDLSAAGHQPVISEDGQTILVYNGELYNFRELSSELESMGHRFRSKTDSEVVLKAMVQWGPAALDRFNGMFAFAIWSADTGKLFLARDPLGMKPLYYTSLPGNKGFVFASEIKAFLALPGFRVTINRNALSQFLEFGYTFNKYMTSMEGVYKLPPGHSLEVVRGEPGIPQAYFVPPRPEQGPGLEQLQKDLHGILNEVVAQHLIADVPVALLLSGGIDSSVLAALAARQGPLHTISMSFSESKVDETPFARIVSRHIGSHHQEVTIQPSEVTEGLEEVAWFFDDLFADWGTVSTRLLYRKCREQGIKVVLVGEGSDELFGGYDIFGEAVSAKGPLPAKLFMLYRRYAGRRYGSHFKEFSAIMRGYLNDGNGDLFHAVRLFESRNQLPNNYVMKVDKASMSVSVEARAPFLDRRVAEFAYRVPKEYLLAEGTTKFLLRSMAERYELLPREITRRPKYGASMAASWIDDSEQFRSYAREVILDRDGWVDELGLRDAMTDYFDGKRTGYSFPRAISIFSNLAWRLLLLNVWSKRYAGRMTVSL